MRRRAKRWYAGLHWLVVARAPTQGADGGSGRLPLPQDDRVVEQVMEPLKAKLSDFDDLKV